MDLGFIVYYMNTLHWSLYYPTPLYTDYRQMNVSTMSLFHSLNWRDDLVISLLLAVHVYRLFYAYHKCNAVKSLTHVIATNGACSRTLRLLKERCIDHI